MLQIKIKEAYIQVPLPMKITGFHSPSRVQRLNYLMPTSDSSLYCLSLVTSFIGGKVNCDIENLGNAKKNVGDLAIKGGKNSVDIF